MDCAFCETSSNDENLGEICQIPREICSLPRRRFHANCLLYASDIRQNKDRAKGYYGFEGENIAFALRRAKRRTCIFCKKKKASIECNERDCQARFHLPCALASKGTLHLHFRGFESYCLEHIPLECIFDYEPITGIHSPFPCCNQVYSHDQCIKKYVIEARAQSKCPLCNDTHHFRTFLNTYLGCEFLTGEPSYAEPQRTGYYLQCTAAICKRSYYGGRLLHLKHTDFELVSCVNCGSDAVHRVCGEGQIDLDGKWVCNSCTSTKHVETNRKAPNKKFESNKVTIRGKDAYSFVSTDNKENANASKLNSSFRLDFVISLFRLKNG